MATNIHNIHQCSLPSKKTPQLQWLRDVSCTPLTQSLQFDGRVEVLNAWMLM
jgi:hypothetical protein